MTTAPQIFDRRTVRLRRQRLLRSRDDSDFLRREVSLRLLERLADIKRPFPLVLDVASGPLFEALMAKEGRRPGRLVRCDGLPALAAAGAGDGVVADEELLPFAPDRFDAALSVMALHWVNDLPGTLAQLRYCLKPDGLLLAAFPGGDTLVELRWALMQAELEIAGGAAARVSPFIDLRDAGMLLQRAGFALPMADQDRITVHYREPWRLIADLRAMGEGNALADRDRRPLRPEVLARALGLYRERFGDAEGTVPATFDIVFLTGWKPHDSQPRPLPRGSGKVDLGQFLGGGGPTDPKPE
ncbi:methyltransferase domain-containing protein [Geminicoccaceae bacterium 1502E]|nr:methyltransferase domain-containing protein [Geminicoccaceae bacterium 1502E]